MYEVLAVAQGRFSRVKHLQYAAHAVLKDARAARRSDDFQRRISKSSPGGGGECCAPVFGATVVGGALTTAESEA